MAERYSDEPDFRILLVGRTGDGKSSTGNSIVGDDVFPHSMSAESVTQTCKLSKTYTRFNKTMEVVDTPGFFDTNLGNMKVFKELLKALVLTTPGFHVIAFVLKRGTRFTDEVRKTKNLFVNWFGRGIENHACLVLTDTNSKEEMKQYLETNSHETLSDLVKMCKDNIVPINNEAEESHKNEQVKDILIVLENIKRNNNNKYFSNIGFHLAEEYIKHKSPRVFTKDSIRLLEKSGVEMEMSEGQYLYHDEVFKAIEEEEEIPKNDDKTEENLFMKQETGKAGNLTIIDNATNEKIPNTLRRGLLENDLKKTDNSSDQIGDGVVEVTESRTEYKKDMNKGARDALRVAKAQQITDNVFERVDRMFDKPKENKKFENKGGKYKALRTSVDQKIRDNCNDQEEEGYRRRREYKNLINEGDSDEELRGLYRYIIKAWRWCKQRASNCSLS